MVFPGSSWRRYGRSPSEQREINAFQSVPGPTAKGLFQACYFGQSEGRMRFPGGESPQPRGDMGLEYSLAFLK